MKVTAFFSSKKSLLLAASTLLLVFSMGNAMAYDPKVTIKDIKEAGGKCTASGLCTIGGHMYQCSGAGYCTLITSR